MSQLLDQLLTKEQLRQCQEWDAHDSCAQEGHIERVSYEDGVAEMEADPWLYWAVVIGVIGGALLSIQ
jgi:hypothetical protein